jgi:large subunit ribosomal protein L23
MGQKVIRRAMVTEKNATHNDKNIYVFEVDMKADKAAIKLHVQKCFGVKVQTVRTAICRGRAKANKFGVGRVPAWKKAFVQLKTGEKITLFEGA